MEKDLYKNSIYKFKRTGNLYRILSSNCKMKNPISREWLPAVIYQSCDDDRVWIRELKEFKERFEYYGTDYRI